MKSTRQHFDLYQHISLHVKAFKYLGIWFYIPYSKTSVRFWLSILSRVLIGFFCFFLPTFGQILYLVKFLLSQKAEVQEAAAIVNLVMTELLTSFQLLDLRLRRRSLTQLMDQLITEQPHYFTPAHTEILEKAVKISRIFFFGLITVSHLDVFVHVVVVPGLTGFKKLPLKMDLIFFDVNEEPYFKYVFAYQILYKPTMVTTFIILRTMQWASMICAISQLDVLIYNFENMAELVKAVKMERNCDEEEAFKEIFKRCLAHHQDVTRLVKKIQSVFGGQLFFSVMLSATIICTTAMQILSIENPLKNITDVVWVLFFLFIVISTLYIDCYYGNTITEKNAKLSIVAFASPWLNFSNDLKKTLIIFMALTQKPLVITAVKLIPVSIQTFTTVMDWTYKGFAVMNQMKK